ncbi:MAG TPA: hypothetical protein VGA73_03950 [Candidatus Binatia bacterium]
MKKPVVLFAVGEVEWRYTQEKFRSLVERARAGGRWEVCVASHTQEICDAFKPLGIKTFCFPGKSLPYVPEQAIAMTDLMIRLTQDIHFPGSRFPLWKAIAMDDYQGCLDLWEPPGRLPVRPDLLVYPLIGIDNSTTASSYFYTVMLAEAKKAGAPVLGVEVSPLTNRQTFAATLADYYAVKTDYSRSFLIDRGVAAADRIFVLPPEENYLLTCRSDPVLDEFFKQEASARERIRAPEGPIVIFIPHNVAFVFEIREILKSLKRLRHPAAIFLNVTGSVTRHSLNEREIAEKCYRDEIRALPNLVVNQEEGWLWTMFLSDVVWGPVCSVYSEMASFYGKLSIVTQTFGEKKWLGENLFLEPDPDQAVRMIESWVEQRRSHQRRLGSIVGLALEGDRAMEPGEAAHGA